MTWKLALIMLTVLFVANQQSCYALSFLDAEHGKKLEREAKREQDHGSITGLELFRSPIQPGGSYGLSLNVMNLIRWIAPNCKLVKKFDRGMSMLDLYVDNLVETDEEVIAFRNEPVGDNNWKVKLKALKDRKRVEYRASLLRQ